MHEYAVTKSILATVLEEARKQGAKRVLEIRLEIGELSSFEEDSIKLYFEQLSMDTIAHGAKIVTRKISAQLYCEECDLHYLLNHVDYDCPKCKQTGVYDGTGNDFLIESIEIE